MIFLFKTEMRRKRFVGGCLEGELWTEEEKHQESLDKYIAMIDFFLPFDNLFSFFELLVVVSV